MMKIFKNSNLASERARIQITKNSCIHFIILSAINFKSALKSFQDDSSVLLFNISNYESSQDYLIRIYAGE